MTQERPELRTLKPQPSLKDFDFEKVSQLYLKTKELAPIDSVSLPWLCHTWRLPEELTKKLLYCAGQLRNGDGHLPYSQFQVPDFGEAFYFKLAQGLAKLSDILRRTNSTVEDVFIKTYPDNQEYLELEEENANQVANHEQNRATREPSHHFGTGGSLKL